MRDSDNIKTDSMPLSTESGKNGRMNTLEWNDYAHSKSVDRFGLWHNDWDSLTYPDMPESPVLKFYKALMETIYENKQKYSLVSNSTSYNLIFEVLRQSKDTLYEDLIIYMPEMNDIIFEIYLHEVIALLRYWEEKDYSESMAIDILKALCYVTATVNSRQEWVHYSKIFPNVNEWERTLRDVKPNF